MISDATGRNRCGVLLRGGPVASVYGDPQYWLEYVSSDIRKIVQPQAVRNRFSKIFVDPQGRLGLVSRKSESVISLAANGQLIMESRRAGIPDKRVVATLQSRRPRRKASVIHCKLPSGRTAAWPGSIPAACCT